MILWQANLGRGVSVGEFRWNLDAILEAMGPRAVLCLQEIDEADKPEEGDYLYARTADTHRVVGWRTAVPILVPKHIPILGERQTLACRGLAKFTPNRPLNQARLQLGPNLVVTVFNFHVPLDRPQTKTRRAAVRRHVRAQANRHENGVYVADTNTRSGWPQMVPGETVVVDAGIDKSRAWSGDDRRIDVSGRRTIPLTIDGHDAHGARIMWTRKK